MANKVVYKTEWFIVIIAFAVGLIFGISVVVNNNHTASCAATQFVPKEMQVITYSNLQLMSTNHDIVCYSPVDGLIFRNGSISLFTYRTDKIGTTSDSIIYAPVDIQIYPDISPYQTIYVDNSKPPVAVELTGQQLCRMRRPTLKYNKLVVYEGKVMVNETRYCNMDGFNDNLDFSNQINSVVPLIKDCINNG